MSLHESGIQRGDVDYGVVSDVGQVRTENQDHHGIHEPERDEDFSRKGRLVVVCDGMGGHNGGTIASRTAVEYVLKTFAESLPGPPKLLLERAIVEANRAVRQKQSEDAALRNMGTTLVACVARGEHLHLAHVGDSRVYRFREGEYEQISRDHTYLNDLIDIGLLTPEKAKNHPERNIITRCVGMADSLEIEFNYRKLAVGDIFLFCSDGLYNHVEDDEMAEIVARQEAQRASQELTDLANKRGGEDNITVSILKILAIPDVDDSQDALAAAAEKAPDIEPTHVAEVSDSAPTPVSGGGIDAVHKTPRVDLARELQPAAPRGGSAAANSSVSSSSGSWNRLTWSLVGILGAAAIFIEILISRY